MNDFNVSMNNHHVSYELAKQMQVETLQRLQHEDRGATVNLVSARTHFLVRYHLRSWMYRLAPRIAARLML